MQMGKVSKTFRRFALAWMCDGGGVEHCCGGADGGIRKRDGFLCGM